MKKILSIIALAAVLCVPARAQGGVKISSYPAVTELPPSYLFLVAAPGVTNNKITATNLFLQLLSIVGAQPPVSSIVTYSTNYTYNFLGKVTINTNVFVLSITATNGVTNYGNAQNNTGTYLTLNVSNALTVAGAPVATFAGITNVWRGALSDMTTALTTGTNRNYWIPKDACTVKYVRANVATVSSSGLPTFDILEGATSILSTLITIDANERSSDTAATPAVISDSAIAAGAYVNISQTVAGTAAAGAQLEIGYTVP